MKDTGEDKNHTWYSRTNNRIGWESVAPSSTLRQGLNDNHWTACFRTIETNSAENPVYQQRGRTWCFWFAFNRSSTSVQVCNRFGNNGFTWGAFTVPSLKVSFWTSSWAICRPCMNTTSLEGASLKIFARKTHASVLKNRTWTVAGVVFSLPL